MVAQGATDHRKGLDARRYESKEGIDPCKCLAMYCTAAHHGQRVPVTSFRTGINDDESGLRHDYEVWLERLALHAPIDQCRPQAGCTIAPVKTPVLDERTGCRRAPEAQRNSQCCA